MKCTTTSMWSLCLIFLTATAVAFSAALVEPVAARGAASGQTDEGKGSDSTKNKEKNKPKNKDKPKSIVKTESGLGYVDIVEGEGKPLKKGQLCDVHYTRWLWENGAKGKKIDSSVERGEPFAFHLESDEVMKGLNEGILPMKVGGKRELLIPADLAYGKRGAGGVIPPDATLFFEIEVLDQWEKTESGLEFRDIKKGTGVKPEAGQNCEVHYTGWLWNHGSKGTKFDSSEGGEPLSFRLRKSRVIEGWHVGVATMKVGSKRRMLIPAKLGYGVDGYPPDIPPNATLLFDVELLKVN